LKKVSYIFGLAWGKYVRTQLNLFKNRKHVYRRLEIGPGNQRIKGFETLDIVPKRNVDYIWDCTKKLPFRNSTFDLIYSSHVLEHIAWYEVEKVLQEWTRILKPGGHLEVWVPDGVKICQAFVDSETLSMAYIDQDGWYKFNPDKDPCLWASGRIYSYGDGFGSERSVNWHRGLFSSRYLEILLKKTGLTDIKMLNSADVRSDSHGWINLGIRGTKN
jgi:SAM-dependent methyltransferase